MTPNPRINHHKENQTSPPPSATAAWAAAVRGSGARRAMAPGWGSPREPQAAITKYISPPRGKKRKKEREKREGKREGLGPEPALKSPAALSMAP